MWQPSPAVVDREVSCYILWRRVCTRTASHTPHCRWVCPSRCAQAVCGGAQLRRTCCLHARRVRARIVQESCRVALWQLSFAPLVIVVLGLRSTGRLNQPTAALLTNGCGGACNLNSSFCYGATPRRCGGILALTNSALLGFAGYACCSGCARVAPTGQLAS